MLNAGQFTCYISTATGVHPSTISRLHYKKCFELQKSTGSCLKKLSPSNIYHTVHFLFSQKPENASAFRFSPVRSFGFIPKRLGLQLVLFFLQFVRTKTGLRFSNGPRSLQVVNWLKASPT